MTSKAQYIIRALLRCHVVALFCILFCLHHDTFVRADSSRTIHSSEISLSVEDGLRCVHKKESITLRCTLSQIINANKTAGWNIVWQSEGELIEQNTSKIFHNTTMLTSTLTVYVNWQTDKVFTCFAAYYEGDLLRGPTINASITLSMMPQQTQINGVRFIEGSDEKLVEIYWKQNEEFNCTYRLIYTIEDDDFGDQVYVINDTECYRRKNDVYRVPNTTGQICKASIKGATFQEYTEYKVQVNTINEQCQITGPIRKFVLSSLGDDPGPNRYDIVIIPQAVSKFTVLVARREVKLTWQNLENLIIKNRWYRLKYNCSGVAAKEQQIDGKTDITLYSRDFPSYQPYALCSFCIQVCLQASNVSSLPFCRETRLHEEKPSKPPRITCMGNECATTNDKRFRNVTITWSLPPRETWNGVLTHVEVIYRRVGNESGYPISVTERNITRGFTVLPMLRNYSYVVETAVCNKEGCSHYGNGSVLGAKVSLEQANESMSAKPGDDLIFPVSLGIGLFFVGIVIGIGVIVWCVRKRSTERTKKENPLPKLDESLDYDNVCGGQIQDEEYGELSDVDLIEDGERNVGLETSDDSQETIM